MPTNSDAKQWHAISNATTWRNETNLFTVWLVVCVDELASKIGIEIKRLQRRGRVAMSTTHGQSIADSGASSPQPSSSMLSLVSASSMPTASTSLLQCRDTPVLSLRQVQLVVGRLLKEHEDKLREEYDKILNEKLTGYSYSFFWLLPKL